MSYDADNIIHGPASLLVDGVNVGYTSGGIKVRRGKELLRIMADQASGPVAIKITSESMFITTTLLEATAKNLALAMDCASSTGTSGVFGASAPELNEHTVTAIGPGPNGKTRTFTFYRAIQSEDVETLIGGREAVGEIPLALELLKDSANNMQFGRFADSSGT